MIDLLHDLRFALRQFRNRPLWTMAIVVVLALGIGANTAMFSGFDAWVLRPLDFEEPHRLVALHESQPRLGRLSVNIAPRNLGDWMDQAQGFEGLGVFTRHQFNFSDDQAPVRVDGARVSASLFPLLGKRPVVGRGFSQDEDQPAQPASVALISHQLWERRFDFDRAIIGRTIRLDGRTHEIVGVMEPGFKFPEWADVWTPLGLDVDAGDRRDRSVNVIARLDTGTGVEAAATQLQDVAARLARQYPESNEGWSANVTRLRDDFVPPVITTALTMSLVAGVLVLLVVCANVASLILAQASARTHARGRRPRGARRRALALDPAECDRGPRAGAGRRGAGRLDCCPRCALDTVVDTGRPTLFVCDGRTEPRGRALHPRDRVACRPRLRPGAGDAELRAQRRRHPQVRSRDSLRSEERPIRRDVGGGGAGAVDRAPDRGAADGEELRGAAERRARLSRRLRPDRGAQSLRRRVRRTRRAPGRGRPDPDIAGSARRHCPRRSDDAPAGRWRSHRVGAGGTGPEVSAWRGGHGDGTRGRR